jgi:hypothetical protein
MKTTVLLIMLVSCAARVVAQQTLGEFTLDQFSPGVRRMAGEPIQIDGKPGLKIVNTNTTALYVRLLTITNPAVTKTLYTVLGEVRYENVRGDGYLEMWNYFPPLKPGLPEGQYFSRTLGITGEMGKITGTSDWRPFALPFNRAGASDAPTRLEVNLFLPGSGTVYISPLKMVEYTGDLPGELGHAWWSDRAAGFIGGLGGALVGCLGGLIGWLVSRGKARTFVILLTVLLVCLGGLCALAGIIAVALRQPYAVYFPLLLGGVLLLGIFIPAFPKYRKRYEDVELRRMASADAVHV